MTIPTLNQNQFAQQPVLGDLDLQYDGSVITAAAASSVATPFVAGQPVKIEDSAGGVPKMLALTSNGDQTFGFVIRNLKDVNVPAGQAFELALKDSVIWLVSDAAISRGSDVEVVYNSNSGAGAVITSAGINPVVGKALDKATAANQLIRVYLAVPISNTTANGGVKTVVVTSTLAQINAGQTLIPGVAGKAITVTNFARRVSGAFATGTSVDLQSSNATPVKVTSTAEAGLTNGAIIVPGSANNTLGAGYAAALGIGDGLVIANVGTAQTGGTSITDTISYIQK